MSDQKNVTGKKRVTDKNVGKKTVKARRIFQKTMILKVTGTSKAVVQKVAAKIHATSTDETTGGAEGRKVQIISESSPVRQVFFGNI